MEILVGSLFEDEMRHMILGLFDQMFSKVDNLIGYLLQTPIQEIWATLTVI